MFKKSIFILSFFIIAIKCIAQENYNYNVKLRSQMQFQGQTLANICGYWQKGNEYALLGASKGMIIVDITNPDKPTQIAQLPGPDNLWKEIKTYKNYAYVTSEGGQGLQCVDLSKLPSPNLDYFFYTGDGDIDGKLGKIHALHIDTLKGVLYCFGSTGVSNSGATMLDIKTNPMKPTYLGSVSEGGYIHDGYAHDDTLYAAHIYRGDLEIWYTKDKKKPVSLGKVTTTTKFTHNVWLSENHKYAFTTDENNNSVLGSYDVSDPSNIVLLDKHVTNPGSGAVVHNTHILSDFAVSSYYTEGFNVVDCHKPDNLVEVARYDTYLPPVNPAAPFEGAWGVFPYFPSGTFVVSNIDEGLFVFTPSYKRAAYVEGVVTDKISKAPLNNVNVVISKYVTADALSTLKGEYKTGVADSGKITLTFSKPGYETLVTTTTVANAKTTILNVELVPLNTYTMGIKVQDAETGAIIPNAIVTLNSKTQNLTKQTNVNGDLSLVSFADTVSIYVGKWGYQIVKEDQIIFNSNVTKTYKIKKGYVDPFVTLMPFSWATENTATAGNWVVGSPIGTQYNGAAATPSTENNTDLGKECYLTGNQSGAPGSSDVDNGFTKITSPSMDLSNLKNPLLKFDYWFFNDGGTGSLPNDSLYMIISTTPNVSKSILIAKTTTGKWNTFGKTFKQLGILPTSDVKISFVAVDNEAGHLVKAAIDNFEVTEGVGVNTFEKEESIGINVSPNPFSNDFVLDYEFENNKNTFVVVTDINGRIVEKISIDNNNGKIRLGQSLPKGIFFVQILSENNSSKALKVIKG